jgi:hypothetical protein
MKPFLFGVVMLLGGCASQSYFRSPNNVSKEKVVLFLRDQPPMAGVLTIPFEADFDKISDYRENITFIPEGKNAEVKIDLSEVMGYSFGKNYYALKKVDVLVNGQYHLLFVHRITEENSKIQLYELYQSGQGNETGETEYSYFISLTPSDQYEAINTKSSFLVPNFHEKMSELVSDCPSLAKKILRRQDGYFFPLHSFKTYKHRDVMLLIIDEYNHCK